MEKHCPDHGFFRVYLSSDAGGYREHFRYHAPGSIPLSFGTDVRKGCPNECGLCPNHEQHVCTPVIEITGRCDLDCPVCLVNKDAVEEISVPELEAILDRLIESEDRIDVLNLSGGEPTMHPEFERIVETCLGRDEIVRVSVSTNGVQLARNHRLARFLAERGVVVSLQYDGSDDDVYRHLRGKPLDKVKRAVLEQGFELDAPMSLIMTMVRGRNESQLAHVLDLLFSHENLLSLMIQPAAFAGRARSFPNRAERRVTIPDVIGMMEAASPRQVDLRADDFSPLPCSHPACFSLAFFLKTGEGRYQSIKRLLDIDRYLDLIRNRALFGLDEESLEKVNEAVYALWSGPAGNDPDSERAIRAVRRILLEIGDCPCRFGGSRAMQVAERSMKSIFLHQFMDAETFDLARLRKCCTVYPQRDGRFLPVCARNVLRS